MSDELMKNTKQELSDRETYQRWLDSATAMREGMIKRGLTGPGDPALAQLEGDIEQARALLKAIDQSN